MLGVGGLRPGNTGDGRNSTQKRSSTRLHTHSGFKKTDPYLDRQPHLRRRRGTQMRRTDMTAERVGGPPGAVNQPTPGSARPTPGATVDWPACGDAIGARGALNAGSVTPTAAGSWAQSWTATTAPDCDPAACSSCAVPAWWPACAATASGRHSRAHAMAAAGAPEKASTTASSAAHFMGVIAV